MTAVTLSLIAALLTGCAASSARIEPIPGSITYNGQPATRLIRAPIGSQVPHDFRDAKGVHWQETYIIQPDRSLLLVDRRRISFPDD
ncbi:hypothetical protein CYG48_05545 [Neorhizobium sp. SOG26]|uniref:hypothetical protein n=1 Tax=Neorhizobium sp. SOG26 TaxID=2060726 RepID=UPI000E5897B4|nr:hypothetical protein [Neorhizobium sp. SOG26]AXV15213.1 hypothetical protein CYG48_05545 [Neorhizobium sp. SOG26]